MQANTFNHCHLSGFLRVNLGLCNQISLHINECTKKDSHMYLLSVLKVQCVRIDHLSVVTPNQQGGAYHQCDHQLLLARLQLDYSCLTVASSCSQSCSQWPCQLSESSQTQSSDYRQVVAFTLQVALWAQQHPSEHSCTRD